MATKENTNQKTINNIEWIASSEPIGPFQYIVFLDREERITDIIELEEECILGDSTPKEKTLHKVLEKKYNGFSGVNIDACNKDGKTFAYCQTIKYSKYKSKPEDPIKRKHISGSLIFANEINIDGFSDPFDIVLWATNARGDLMSMMIKGVELLYKGYAPEIEDIGPEISFDFIAKEEIKWQRV